jgi:octaprenyl-diphosphate synthase
MALPVDVPNELAGVIASGLERVRERFDGQLRSDLPPVRRLCGHVENYRGKMLRPLLVLASGMAAGGEILDEHVTCAAVCEMVHMATLVHDDVLDEAEVRRRGATVNRLHGNEAAVILGDYLIAAAYHLCSQLGDQGIALRVAGVSMTLCAGELLQLSHREDLSLDERTYFEIIERKTASLVALSCRLGGECSGAGAGVLDGLERFGMRIGAAFQIQDDLLDLTGRESALGKPVGQDMSKGKLTLPMVHHLGAVGAADRGRTLVLLERASEGDREAGAGLVRAMERSGSLEHASRVARELVNRARGELRPLEESAAKDLLISMADGVVDRSR